MLVNKYLKSYLQNYSPIHLLGLGTLYRTTVPVEKKDGKLTPPSYAYVLNEQISDSIQHFVLYVNQFENSNFEELLHEIKGDFEFMKLRLLDGNRVELNGIGTLIYFNNEVTLFEENVNSRYFGYPKL